MVVEKKTWSTTATEGSGFDMVEAARTAPTDDDRDNANATMPGTTLRNFIELKPRASLDSNRRAFTGAAARIRLEVRLGLTH